MSAQRRHAPMATTPIIHMLVRRMATMVRNGLWAAYSLEQALGITAFTAGAMVTMDAVDMASVAVTMAGATIGLERTLTIEAAGLVTAGAMRAAPLAVVFTPAEVAFTVGAAFTAAADAGKSALVTQLKHGWQQTLPAVLLVRFEPPRRRMNF